MDADILQFEEFETEGGHFTVSEHRGDRIIVSVSSRGLYATRASFHMSLATLREFIAVATKVADQSEVAS